MVEGRKMGARNDMKTRRTRDDMNCTSTTRHEDGEMG